MLDADLTDLPTTDVSLRAPNNRDGTRMAPHTRNRKGPLSPYRGCLPESKLSSQSSRRIATMVKFTLVTRSQSTALESLTSPSRGSLPASGHCRAGRAQHLLSLAAALGAIHVVACRPARSRSPWTSKRARRRQSQSGTARPASGPRSSTDALKIPRRAAGASSPLLGGLWVSRVGHYPPATDHAAEPGLRPGVAE